MTHRRLLRTLCFAAFASAFPLAADAADWPQFLGPNRDSTSPEKGLLTTWPKDGPPVVWQHDVGEGFSSPVVSGGRVIVFHRLGGEEVVECLDAADGKPRWKHAYACHYKDPFGKGNGPRSTPVVSGDKVYTVGAGGMLTCLTRDEGKQIWKVDLAREYRMRDSFFGVGTTPLVEGDLLVLNVGAAGAGIVAFGKNTGKEVWKATDDEASYASPVAATIDGVRHLLFFTRVGLVSLDPAKGEVRFRKRWRSRMDASVNAATPLVIGDQVLITASYNTGAAMLKVKKDGVEEAWANDRTLSSQYNTPVHHDGCVYGIDGRADVGEAELRCVDVKTGKIHWSQERFGCSSIILANGNLIILTEGGDLVLAEASPERYQEKARASLLTGPCRAHPALAEGRLYARDTRKLVCWNVKKGG
jgi:outer membrane protein assembly factor BamB